MPLPDGLRQDGEGVQRCLDCGGEGIAHLAPDGTRVLLTPIRGEHHDCAQWQDRLAALYEETLLEGLVEQHLDKVAAQVAALEAEAQALVQAENKV